MQRLLRARRRIRYRFAPHALILMYHRVVELQNDPHLLAVTPKRFAAHLEVIRGHCSPVPLSTLVGSLAAGRVPNRAVVISFDDGYADNLEQAKPWLEAYEIPATVFVAAGQVGQQDEFWWDELDRLLLQPGNLPSTLRLSSNGIVREWDLGGASQYSAADYWRDRDWNIEREDAPTMRQHLFRDLFDWLYGMPETDKQRLLESLRKWAGIGQAGRVTHRALTENEMFHLSEGGLVEIGAHTMTHPLLSELQVEEQRSEIRQSKEHLEAILKRPVTSFALPHGSSTAETLSILAEAGFECACTSEADAVWTGSDRFQLPRLGVRNWDEETFAHWLRWWMDG